MSSRRMVAVLVALGLGGCASPPGGFDSPDPAARMTAIGAAARDEDRAAIPHLIPLLESDDAAVRLAAIRTLERLTGRTLGYHHADPEWKRREAVDRWVGWYEAGGATAAPSPRPAEARDPASPTPPPTASEVVHGP